MGLKKHLNKVLALGLTISSVYVSTHTVYALNEDANKEAVKTNSKIELNVDKEEVKTTKRAIVTTSVLNVREEASQEAEKIGALVEGNVVTVLETKEDWSKVQISDEKEGWVSSEFIANEKAKVNVDELNLRKEASTEGEKIETLKRNTELEILSVLEIENKEEETTDVWYEVKIIEEESSEEVKAEDESKEKEDKIGFVFAEYTLTESEEAKQIEEARKKAEAEKKASEEAQKTVQNNTVVSNATSNNSSTTSKKEPVKESVKEPSKETASSSNSSNLAGRTITVNASAYSGHSITATGTVPKWGTIAVDPTVIPYGTKVYIPMFDKVFIAEDCGGAIKGNKIDIFMNSSEETKNFGRRNIEIKILG